jgi:MFS family permease
VTAPPAGALGAPRRTSLLRHPDFLRFWSAQTISQFGSQVSILALPLVAISFLDSSPAEVALLSTMEFLPFVFFALPAGVWIDRLRRRPILIGADIARALLLATIPAAWVAGVLTIWQLYAVAFLVGCFTVFFDVAYQAYLPSLVERDRILDGNAKLETSRSVAQTAGPAIAGWLIGALTAPIAVIVNSISFVASGVFLVAIRRPEADPGLASARSDVSGAMGADAPVADHRPGLRREVAAGLRYVFANPYLRAIAITMSLTNFFGQVVFSLFFVYAVRELGLEAGALGLILGIGNIGLIVGAVTASAVARRIGFGPAIIASIWVAGSATVLIPLAPASAPAPFLIAQGLLFGWSVLVFNVNQVSYRQSITPEHLQGRMNATMKFIAVLMIPAGSIAGGLLATAFGLHAAIWVGSIGALFSFVPALVSPLRGLRTIPTEVAGEAAQVGAAGAAGADAATAPAAPRSPLVEPSPEPMLGEID